MTMKKAFHIARSGRPGPVVVDIPKDVSFNKTAYAGYPDKVEMRSYNPVRKGHGGQIRKALQLLLAAKRPYIYTGGGVILGNASSELRTLVDMLGYPVHQHADGPGRLSRRATASSSACWACTAPSKPTTRCRTATCCWPSARASTTA